MEEGCVVVTDLVACSVEVEEVWGCLVGEWGGGKVYFVESAVVGDAEGGEGGWGGDDWGNHSNSGICG